MKPFRAALPPLYVSSNSRVFAYVPGATQEALSMAQVLESGGTLIYTARPPGDPRRFLKQLLVPVPPRPGALYLGNRSENHRHWARQVLYCNSDSLSTACCLRFGPFTCRADSGAELSAGEDSAWLSPVRFGRGGMVHEGKALLQWDGVLRMKLPLYGWLGTGVYYFRDAYDELTRQNLLSVTRADSLLEDVSVVLDATLMPCAPLECAFQVPEDARLCWEGLPPMRARGFSLRFAQGDGAYTLAPEGGALLEQDCHFGGTAHGVFHGKRGDKVFFLPGGQAHITRPEAATKMSVISSSAHYDAGGPPLVLAEGKGMPYSTSSTTAFDEALAERARRVAEDPANRFAAEEGIHLLHDGFPLCWDGGTVRWLRFAETQPAQPGLALCEPVPGLAHCMAWPGLFMVLCGETAGCFSTPYMLTAETVEAAVSRGYPAEDGKKLLFRYPRGRVFLSRGTFIQAVRAAGALSAESLEEAADAFTFSAQGTRLHLNPAAWAQNGTILVLKGSRQEAGVKLIRDPGRWSFPPPNEAAIRDALLEIAEGAAASPVSAAFYDGAWRGALAIRCPVDTGGLVQCVMFPMGEMQPVVWQ